jgi:putative effector of murein hydrolase
MQRTTAAFLIAPLWVPATAGIYAFWMFPHPEQSFWRLATAVIGGLFGYAGTLGFGIPLFIVLRSTRLVSVWIAIAVGFMAGEITWIIFLTLFALSLGNSTSFAVSEFLRPDQWSSLSMLAPGFLGALVGATLWLIARPDRLSQH